MKNDSKKDLYTRFTCRLEIVPGDQRLPEVPSNLIRDLPSRRLVPVTQHLTESVVPFGDKSSCQLRYLVG
jgi:hypothetical protein